MSHAVIIIQQCTSRTMMTPRNDGRNNFAPHLLHAQVYWAPKGLCLMLLWWVTTHLQHVSSVLFLPVLISRFQQIYYWICNTSITLTLTRSSLSGWGIRRPLTCVTIGPSWPASIIVSPSFILPLTSTTSIVVPKPGRAFTWQRNVHKYGLCNPLEGNVWIKTLTTINRIQHKWFKMVRF